MQNLPSLPAIQWQENRNNVERSLILAERREQKRKADLAKKARSSLLANTQPYSRQRITRVYLSKTLCRVTRKGTKRFTVKVCEVTA